MALRIWLPLNGNVNNYGLANDYSFAVGSATIDNSGKIGKCYNFSSTSSNGINLLSGNVADFMNTYINNQSWSLCAWVKNAINNGDTCVISLSYGLRLFAGSSTYVSLYNSSRSVSCNSSVGTGDNKWHHIVATYNSNNNAIKIYVDGVNTGNATYTNGYKYASSWVNGIFIGKDPNNNTANAHYFYQGQMNDVRVYDHDLSPLEVKHLAQGLVLHYPLNRGGFGQENLITQTMIDTDPWKSAISGTYTVDGKTGWILANNILYSKSGNGTNNIFSGLTYDSDTQYTISFKWRDDYRTDGKSSSLYIRFKYSDGTYTQVISPKCDYWKEEVMTSTAGKTVSAITTTYGNGGNLLFTDLKLEKGITKTPFSPIVNSDQYTAMGFNSIIEYDCSGYGNNGTRNGVFSWSGDTPRYGCSTIFNGIDNAIQTPNLTTMITDKNYTISCWTYKTVIGTKNYQTIYGGPSGFELEARNGSGTDPLFRIYNWGGGTTPYVFGEWTHFCFVHTDSDSKLYINGELKITGSSVNIPSGNYYIGAWKVATSQNYDGLMSDFRIYATALSEEDVLELYHAPISLTSDGTLMAQGEYVEV